MRAEFIENLIPRRPRVLRDARPAASLLSMRAEGVAAFQAVFVRPVTPHPDPLPYGVRESARVERTPRGAALRRHPPLWGGIKNSEARATGPGFERSTTELCFDPGSAAHHSV